MNELNELNEERVKELSNKLLLVVRDHYLQGPLERVRVYEVLNALAFCSAITIRGADQDEALEWFSRALNTNLKQ